MDEFNIKEVDFPFTSEVAKKSMKTVLKQDNREIIIEIVKYLSER